MGRIHKIGYAALIAVFILAYTPLEWLGSRCLQWLGGNPETQYYLADTLSCVFMLVFYGTLLFILRHKQQPVLPEMQVRARTYGAAVIMTLGVGGISYLWLLLVDVLPPIPFIAESAQRFEEMGTSMGTEPYPWVFFSVVLLGPIVEELLFRGLVFQEAEKIHGGVFAVVVSAVLFGIFHMEFVQGVYTFFMGLVFGYIYLRTRSLVLVCFAHVLNNIIASPPPFLENDLFFSVATVVQVVMILPGAYVLWRWFVHPANPDKMDPVVLE